MTAEPVPKIMSETAQRMDHAIEGIRREFASIRSGRANPALVDQIMVEAYETRMPLIQLATIAAPEPRLLVITPWDKTLIGAIRNALTQSDLGLNPASDGNILRVPVPELSEERRKDLAKVVGRKTEEGRVAVRNIRRDAIEELRKLQKAGDVSEDDAKRAQEDVQKTTDAHIEEINHLHEAKVAEIMEV
ncbi:MAG: ribosome recycling factor [Armatimonadota bacterium]|nr:MAG: ribosome recycling factor [Armatimonadota bacterium]